ncbi:MAG: YggS family pyridoxal phosphate-dependent enzyme, partial [Alphaproteobacteria bacterium]|nr:YggS family pyridoxal phosphate-dependent enzyme [Alphaproteobacteria bacterium]
MSDQTQTSVAENLGNIQTKINAAVQAYWIKTGITNPVTLVAVSKRQLDVRIDAALAAGQRAFGENRVQEAQTRWAHRRDQYKDLRLHLIGPLQTNKAGDAVALFDVIEVVDRPKLAKALGDEMVRQNRQLECYVQVNTGEEAQKSGIAPDDADNFIAYCRDEVGLNVTGLMCIPPVEEEASMHFALLNIIAKRNGLAKLSMG